MFNPADYHDGYNTSAVVKGDVAMGSTISHRGCSSTGGGDLFQLLEEAQGALRRRSFSVGEGLLLKPCKSVHSYFVGFPFDVVFLNEDMVIVHIMESMPLIASALSSGMLCQCWNCPQV